MLALLLAVLSAFPVLLSYREAKLRFLLHRCFTMFRLALGWLVRFRGGIVGWSPTAWKETADFSTFASDTADLPKSSSLCWL